MILARTPAGSHASTSSTSPAEVCLLDDRDDLAWCLFAVCSARTCKQPLWRMMSEVIISAQPLQSTAQHSLLLAHLTSCCLRAVPCRPVRAVYWGGGGHLLQDHEQLLLLLAVQVELVGWTEIEGCCIFGYVACDWLLFSARLCAPSWMNDGYWWLTEWIQRKSTSKHMHVWEILRMWIWILVYF
jgi:hypothetical protein